jgi:hypothetical protein
VVGLHEPPIPFQELRVEPFKETADVHGFDCGNKELNDFLTTEEVANYEKEMLGTTYLVYWIQGGILVAYFTIASQSLSIEYLRKVKGFSIPPEIRLKDIPGMLIGRLGVDINYKRRTIGSHILRYIAGLALGTSAATRILFLEAYPESVPFYEAFKFRIIEHQKLKHSRNRLMYYDLKNHPEKE